MATCQICITDTEDAIISKLKHKQDDLNQAISGIMRHKADIPVLAAALSMKPEPHVIVSGNREHFNDEVANRCGIKICSCQEFIEFIS